MTIITSIIDEHGQVMIAKTGLGSSAALTSSLVGCLLQYFDIIHIGLHADSNDRRITHNLSQLIHCNVQGSVGSGFDIASCIYGTQMYRRFSTLGFDSCMEDHVASDIIYSAVMSHGLATSIPTTPSVNALMDKASMNQSVSSTTR
jgi:phosphomevalonate kinase